MLASKVQKRVAVVEKRRIDMQMELRLLLAGTMIAAATMLSGCEELGDCCERCTYTDTSCEEDVTRSVCDDLIEVHSHNDGCSAWFEPY